MSKIEKLIARFLSKPKDFSWVETVRILNNFGYEEIKNGKTGGSRRKFFNSKNHIISLHEPHPANILKSYQIDLIIKHLKEHEELF